ncbi:GT-D fold domain-containing protein [Cohnella cholangitidis]|uniref:GT-D fold-like domain-containing protein n=1 Tax=Cohnella cholangitidis TaxID=2598458 RepID=A0A7G5BUY8_9BACL|nr:GT-D fold domain-containing glycosyltransferase [Cohnella cholangitidis]QMV40772.1 hypothetical protein FPL14_05810 [Cohnella cholangitidis]
MLEQAAASYNQGFDAGYDEALSKSGQSVSGKAPTISPDKAYRNGVYDAGEGIVDSILPDTDILPDISVRQIIEAGIEHLRPRLHRVLSATEVNDCIISAMNSKSPLSIVRLGDGELLTLAQEAVMNEEEVRIEGHFLSYAGVHLPDLDARDQLVRAITKADIVGIPKLRLPNFQPLAFAAFKAHGIHYGNLRMTLSTINYTLYLEGFFRGMLTDRRVLVVGNSSPGLAQVLSDSGIRVIGSVSPVKGIPDIPRVMREIADYDFDIALVGAGVPAVIIVQRIASELGKVAIDFGHLADSFVKGEAAL